ncbi:MAG: hypothetical protein M5U29_02635 [Anaerolineae bacterium]|nr:hypothetical protein [Anaerolineae bacterium]
MNSAFLATRQCALAIMLFCLAACAPEPPARSASPLPQPTAPPATPGASEVITVAARPPQATPMPTPSAEPLSGGPACGASDLIYAIDAVLDWTARSVRVTERIAFSNDTGQALDSIVLAIPGVIDLSSFTLSRVALGDGSPLRDYVLRDSQIIIPLPSPPGAGQHNAGQPGVLAGAATHPEGIPAWAHGLSGFQRASGQPRPVVPADSRVPRGEWLGRT